MAFTRTRITRVALAKIVTARGDRRSQSTSSPMAATPRHAPPRGMSRRSRPPCRRGATIATVSSGRYFRAGSRQPLGTGVSRAFAAIVHAEGGACSQTAARCHRSRLCGQHHRRVSCPPPRSAITRAWRMATGLAQLQTSGPTASAELLMAVLDPGIHRVRAPASPALAAAVSTTPL